MIKNRLACFLILIAFASCKHDPLTESVSEPVFSAPDVLYTSDSFLLSPASALWRLSPNIGELTSTNYYKAPSSVLNDQVDVTITAITTVRSWSKAIRIMKREASDTVISFSNTIVPLMIANCNFRGCHGNGSKAGKVDLSTYEAAMNSTVKYQPSQSLLYLSLVKPDPVRRMPPAGALHEYRINFFKKWIEQGALNN